MNPALRRTARCAALRAAACASSGTRPRPTPRTSSRISSRTNPRAFTALTVAIVTLGVAIASLAAPSPLQAHRPFFVWSGSLSPSTAVVIAQPAVSWAFYATLPSPDARQYYRFEGLAGQVVFVQILVPLQSDLQLAPPRATIVGPATLARIESAADPTAANEYVIRTETDEHEEFYESFTQITYDQYPALRIELPDDGTYWIIVEAPDEAMGNYVLAVGTEEVFAARDLPRFPVWWWNARQHAHLPTWHGVALVGALVAAILGLVLIFWGRR